MARVTGLEPATSGVTGRRSNQLSYTPAKGVRRISQQRAQVKARLAIGAKAPKLARRERPATHFVAGEHVHGVRRQRLGRPHQRRTDPHAARVFGEHGDHRRVGETARHTRRAAPAASLTLDDRHAMKRYFAARRRDAAHGAHHGVDAGRQAFAGVRTRVAARVESADDARGAQLSKDVAEHHRGGDIAAPRIDEHDSTQRLIIRSRFEEVDERSRRVGLDNAVGDDDVRAPGAAGSLSLAAERETSSSRNPPMREWR